MLRVKQEETQVHLLEQGMPETFLDLPRPQQRELAPNICTHPGTPETADTNLNFGFNRPITDSKTTPLAKERQDPKNGHQKEKGQVSPNSFC